jgi:hypothetical protein
MKNTLHLFVLSACIIIAHFANAQWSGPTANTLNTSNNIKISLNGGSVGMPGTTFPNIFETQLTGMGRGTSVLYPLTVSYGGNVGIGTNTPKAALDVKGNMRISGNTANPTSIETFSRGNITITTDGFPVSRGLFIKSPTADILNVTPEFLSYSLAGNTVLKVDANVNSFGDIIIKDNNNDINFRAYTDGTVRAREVRVNLATIPPDYVFEKSYNLLPIEEVEKYIIQNKHLPNVPSAKEMMEQGSMDVSAMQLKLLEKVEELTLYIIELKNENEKLQKRVCSIENQKY